MIEENKDCEFCKIDNGNYLFSRDCCCARFIEHIPTKTLRVAWMNRWLTQFGEERTEHIKQLVQEVWDAHRQEALRKRI